MLVRYLLYFLCISPAFTNAGTNDGQTTINNDISECVSLDVGSPYSYKNLTLVDVHLNVKEVIGLCGCKSALINIGVRGADVSFNEIYGGKESRSISLVTAFDNSIKNKTYSELGINVGCGSR